MNDSPENTIPVEDPTGGEIPILVVYPNGYMTCQISMEILERLGLAIVQKARSMIPKIESPPPRSNIKIVPGNFKIPIMIRKN
jgi:hypothetical protein